MNAFDADMVVRQGPKVVKLDFACNGIEEHPPLTAPHARAQLRAVAQDMLRVVNTPP